MINTRKNPAIESDADKICSISLLSIVIIVLFSSVIFILCGRVQFVLKQAKRALAADIYATKK